MKYYIQFGIGKVKYLVNFHDGVKTHRDGSPFFDARTFRNKRKLASFIADLEARGYCAA